MEWNVGDVYRFGTRHYQILEEWHPRNDGKPTYKIVDIVLGTIMISHFSDGFGFLRFKLTEEEKMKLLLTL